MEATCVRQLPITSCHQCPMLEIRCDADSLVDRGAYCCHYHFPDRDTNQGFLTRINHLTYRLGCDTIPIPDACPLDKATIAQ